MVDKLGGTSEYHTEGCDIDSHITPSYTIYTIGDVLVSNLNMIPHFGNVVRSFYYKFHCLRSVCKY